MEEKNKDREPFQFRPITSGLGFHPFSNGLPYAPVAKKSPIPSTGSGAVSAGPPRFVPPRAVASPAAGIATRPIQPRPPAQVATPVSLQPRVTDEGAFGWAYLFKRVLAYGIDTAVNLALAAGAFALIFWQLKINWRILTEIELIVVGSIFLGFLNWALVTAQEIAFRTSLGKRLFGLTLEANGSAAIFLRAFFFPVSLATGGLGVIWALFDKKKRCWHDLLSEVQPIEIARL